MDENISAEELKRKLKEYFIIDVRENDEYQREHIESAINIPLGKLIRDESKGIIPRDKKIIVHCKSGLRGGMALEFLKKREYANIMNLKGGFDAWKIACEKVSS